MEERTEYKGYYYRIEQDTEAMNPRTEFDNLGHMICFHKRYDLGDRTDLKSSQFDGWDELEKYLIKEEKAYIILPLFLYDHSGITMSTGREYPFNDRWDAGQVGFIYITAEEIRKEYSVKHIPKELKEKVTKYLEGEVKVYDMYLTGEVYGFVVEDEDEDVIESCWGFYGYPDGYNEAENEAKSIIDSQVEEDEENRAETTKQEVGELVLT